METKERIKSVYLVMAAERLLALEELVSDHLNTGYELVGGLIYVSDNDRKGFYQAMVKHGN